MALHRRGGDAKPGITCYNCGVFTTHVEWQELVMEHLRADRLQQCPTFHMDLFGGEPSKISGRMRDKWRTPE